MSWKYFSDVKWLYRAGKYLVIKISEMLIPRCDNLKATLIRNVLLIILLKICNISLFIGILVDVINTVH